MLLLVVESGGSSPGRAGFKMAVTVSGRSHGTIGGGAMEKELAEQAARAAGPRHGPAAAAEAPAPRGGGGEALGRPYSGGICSGWQRVALLPLAGGDSDAVDSLLFALKRNRPGRLQFSPRGMDFQPRKKQAAAVAFSSPARTKTGSSARRPAGARP